MTAKTSDEVASSSKGSRAEKALVAPRVCIVSSKALDVSSRLCWLLPGEQSEGKRERAKACRNLDKQSQPEKQKVVHPTCVESLMFEKTKSAHLSLAFSSGAPLLELFAPPSFARTENFMHC